MTSKIADVKEAENNKDGEPQPSKFEKMILPIQNFTNNHSRPILTSLFIVANLLLIGFSSAVIGLLNYNNRHCNVAVTLVSVYEEFNFTRHDAVYTNYYGTVFNYERIYNAIVPFSDYHEGQRAFWAILNSIFICILATSVITVLTLAFFLIAQSAASGKSTSKFNQKVASTMAKSPPMFTVSRTGAFVGAVLQILLFCCMTAILMAAILQANFEDEYATIMAERINVTLNGELPTLATNQIEAVDQTELSFCWASVYSWIDGDPVVRFGVILLAVSTFELMSIFTCAALMKRPSSNTDEDEPLMTGIDDPDDQPYDLQQEQSRSKEMEMKNKNNNNA